MVQSRPFMGSDSERDHASSQFNGNRSPPRRASMDIPMSPATSARHLSHKQQLGLAGLVSLIFLEVCGGPFGSEESVQYGGPLIAIVGFIILPLIWSIPEALVTAELATAFPENAGYVVWVGTAFGPFWGFMEGLFSWVSGVTDNTIYPVVFVSYLKLFWSAIGINWWLEKSILMVSSLLMTMLNWRGLDIVGRSAEVIVTVTMLPFVVLGVLAIPKIRPRNWLITKPLAKVQWGEFLNVMFWNLNYWDSVSTLAGEVRNPGQLFPRALGLGVVLVVATYLLPLMVGIGVTTDTNADWSLGYYGHIGQLVGGKWLALAIVIAAAVSQIGQFEAEMSSDSYQVLGMAERGYLPRVFAMRSRYGTPVIGILLSSVGIMTTIFFSFMEIVELLNAIYCLAELLEFAAFVYLRVKRPGLPRDFRVPFGVPGLLVMLLPATLLLITLLCLPFIRLRWKTITYTVGIVFLGLFIYPLLQLLRRTRLVDFVASELDSERWSSGSLAASMTFFPTLCVVVGLAQMKTLQWPLIGAIALGTACCVCLLLWVTVVALLRKYEVLEAPSPLGDGAAPDGAFDEAAPVLMDLNTPLLDPFLEEAPNLPPIKVS